MQIELEYRKEKQPMGYGTRYIGEENLSSICYYLGMIHHDSKTFFSFYL